MNKFCSIIIRTKNEERWISSCLREVFNQTHKDFEVIIVDNYSKDKTIEKAKEWPIKKIIKIKKYLPGLALNMGIKESKGNYLVFLSAHCIPKNKFWLSCLVNSLNEDKKYAAVYGRQEPMSFTPLADKRDLNLLFGLDRRIHIKDSFFHNANSIIHKKLLKKFPFDEETTNIEDRLWAQIILKKGFNILYEPKASVYHYHGINQSGNNDRLTTTAKIIENNLKNYSVGKLNPSKLKIIAIVPVKGETKKFKNKTLLEQTIAQAKKSKYIKKIIISTDNKKTSKIAIKAGALCPFLRPNNLSLPFINLEAVQNFTLKKIEELKIHPDLIVHLEETFPFRTDNLIDEMIKRMLEEGFDTLIAAKEEGGWFWKEDENNKIIRIDQGDIPRNFKEKTFLGLKGLCMITYPEFIRDNKGLGKKIGLFKVNNSLSNFEIKSSQDIKIAEKLI
tara:strand:- start:1912 stop:3252 length:1341 start_codon:yes stop_codon:yes gene_type:complete